MKIAHSCSVGLLQLGCSGWQEFMKSWHWGHEINILS